MTLGTAEIREIAEALRAAEVSGAPIPPPSARTDVSLEEAYRIQEIGVAGRVDRGERLIGRKVGLTSLAMQRQLGVDQPDFGVLTDAMLIPDGGALALPELIAPRVEPEYAFRIDGELPVSPSEEEVRAAVGAVSVAIEVIDSRVADWRIGLADTVADNASSARLVAGPWREAAPGLLGQIVDTEIELLRDGEIVGSGPGSAVLGDPVRAVHWLSTAIGRFGEALAPGSIVLAGAVTGAMPIAAGQTWSARAAGFGPVTVTVADPRS